MYLIFQIYILLKLTTKKNTCISFLKDWVMFNSKWWCILVLFQSPQQAYSSITRCPWLTCISSLIHCVFSYGGSAVYDLGTSWYSPVPGTAHRASHETSCETSGYRKWQTFSHSPGSHTVKGFKTHMKPEKCRIIYMYNKYQYVYLASKHFLLCDLANHNKRQSSIKHFIIFLCLLGRS